MEASTKKSGYGFTYIANEMKKEAIYKQGMKLSLGGAMETLAKGGIICSDGFFLQKSGTVLLEFPYNRKWEHQARYYIKGFMDREWFQGVEVEIPLADKVNSAEDFIEKLDIDDCSRRQLSIIIRDIIAGANIWTS